MGAVALVARVGCVFALLGLTLWALSRWDGRAGKSRRKTPTPLRVVASVRLAKGAAVSVVEVAGEELVLGVTDGQVSLLSTSRATTSPTTPFAAALDTAAAQLPSEPTTPPTRPAPPTAGEFLGSVWQVARKRPVATTAVSDAAVQDALSAVGARPHHVTQPAADGSAALAPSTDAGPSQEQAWPPGFPQAAARARELPVVV